MATAFEQANPTPFTGSTADPTTGGNLAPGSLDPTGVLTGTGAAGGKFGPEVAMLVDPLNFAGRAPHIETGQLEAFIREISPEARELIRQGAEQALGLTTGATGQAIESLQPFGGTAAFDEQAALLGALGPEAQQAAIAAIPVSEADKFQEHREGQTLRRQASARGELGGGATLEGAALLGGGQMQRRIESRLSALSPLSATERGVASTMSGLTEAGAGRQASILAGMGPQLAAINLGQIAPITEARTTAAELQALQGINRAQQQAQLLGQFGQLAQQFIPNSNPFTSTPTTTLSAVPGQPTFGASR